MHPICELELVESRGGAWSLVRLIRQWDGRFGAKNGGEPSAVKLLDHDLDYHVSKAAKRNVAFQTFPELRSFSNPAGRTRTNGAARHM